MEEREGGRKGGESWEAERILVRHLETEQHLGPCSQDFPMWSCFAFLPFLGNYHHPNFSFWLNSVSVGFSFKAIKKESNYSVL
jgi:hypothetical protein